MILNAAREAVWNATPDQPSLCPECTEELYARRPERRVWHWCHKPSPHPRLCTSFEESEWHLCMKLAYYELPGWQIEMPVEVNGKKYRIDAANQRTGRLREFIHSLSSYYVNKHCNLKNFLVGFDDILWIFDGAEFAVDNLKKFISSNGKPYFRHLLKFHPTRLYAEIGGLIHYDDSLWHQWNGKDGNADMWFQNTGDRAQKILELYNKVKAQLQDGTYYERHISRNLKRPIRRDDPPNSGGH